MFLYSEENVPFGGGGGNVRRRHPESYGHPHQQEVKLAGRVPETDHLHLWKENCRQAQIEDRAFLPIVGERTTVKLSPIYFLKNTGTLISVA